MCRSRINPVLVVALLLTFASFAFAKNETEWLAVLQKPDATLKEKHDACRELARVGTAKSVPVLTDLLADEKLSHMARYALEPIDDPSVDAALRGALGKVKGRPLLGVIGSVGVRGDEKAVPALSKLLSGKDPAVTQAAARALGEIGTQEAAAALQSALSKTAPAQCKVVCEGLFRCAESLADAGKGAQAAAIYDRILSLEEAPHQIRTAALRGAVLSRGDMGLPVLMKALRDEDYSIFAAAARISMEMKGSDVTGALAGKLAMLPAERQVLLTWTLGNRGDAEAAPALFALLSKGEGPARAEAVKALARLAHEPALPELVKLSLGSDGDLRDVARASLAGFPCKAADKTVTGLLTSSDTNTRLLGIEMVGERRLVACVPTLLRVASSDAQVGTRIAALHVLRDLAGMDQLAALLDVLLKEKSADVIEATEQTVMAVSVRGSSASATVGALVTALDQASGPAELSLLRVLRSVGGEKALQAVTAVANGSAGEARQTAQRMLCDWPTPDALPAVMKLATDPPNAKLRVLALRGSLRLIALQDAPPQAKLVKIKTALALAERTEEKRLALSALGEIYQADTLALVLPYLNDADLRVEASTAAVGIADKIANEHPDAVVGAMSRVVDVSTDEAIKNQARQLLTRADRAALWNVGYQPAGSWQPLFNGTDLSGWEKTGDGVVTVEGGNLVGTQTDGKGGNIWAPGQWSDFELRAVYRVDWPANSGIWFRHDGKRGYQYDILKYKRPEAYSGTLYCPGKMFIITNLDESLENRDGWNHARVRAAGPHITQWLNGVVTGSVKDDLLSTGKIGLQVHGGEQLKGMKIIVKSLEVRPLKSR